MGRSVGSSGWVAVAICYCVCCAGETYVERDAATPKERAEPPSVAQGSMGVLSNAMQCVIVCCENGVRAMSVRAAALVRGVCHKPQVAHPQHVVRSHNLCNDKLFAQIFPLQLPKAILATEHATGTITGYSCRNTRISNRPLATSVVGSTTWTIWIRDCSKAYKSLVPVKNQTMGETSARWGDRICC